MGYPGDPIPGAFMTLVKDGEAWYVEYERTHSATNPDTPGFMSVNPRYVRPERRRDSTDWHCTYCGGLRPSETFRCEGCGASR